MKIVFYAAAVSGLATRCGSQIPWALLDEDKGAILIYLLGKDQIIVNVVMLV
jgi:hypothetical protein